MGKRKREKEINPLFELRVRIPRHLGELFMAEAAKERRKYNEQIAKILDERYGAQTREK